MGPPGQGDYGVNHLYISLGGINYELKTGNRTPPGVRGRTPAHTPVRRDPCVFVLTVVCLAGWTQ